MPWYACHGCARRGSEFAGTWNMFCSLAWLCNRGAVVALLQLTVRVRLFVWVCGSASGFASASVATHFQHTSVWQWFHKLNLTFLVILVTVTKHVHQVHERFTVALLATQANSAASMWPVHRFDCRPNLPSEPSICRGHTPKRNKNPRKMKQTHW